METKITKNLIWNKIRHLLFLIFALSSSCTQHRANINWPEFMEKQDLVFDSLGSKWENAKGIIPCFVFRR